MAESLGYAAEEVECAILLSQGADEVNWLENEWHMMLTLVIARLDATRQMPLVYDYLPNPLSEIRKALAECKGNIDRTVDYIVNSSKDNVCVLYSRLVSSATVLRKSGPALRFVSNHTNHSA